MTEEISQLKRIVADLVVQNDILKAVNAKKMVSPSSKRRAVQYVQEQGRGGKVQACRALGLVRSGLYRLAKRSSRSVVLHRQIIELSRKHPRYGYQRVTAMMERAGEVVTPKRTQRVRRQEGLGVSKK
ncbi:MAG: hypothetical protein OHK005_14120 [Candidatus Methylacidiphilales bacterium]